VCGERFVCVLMCACGCMCLYLCGAGVCRYVCAWDVRVIVCGGRWVRVSGVCVMGCVRVLFVVCESVCVYVVCAVCVYVFVCVWLRVCRDLCGCAWLVCIACGVCVIHIFSGWRMCVCVMRCMH